MDTQGRTSELEFDQIIESSQKVEEHWATDDVVIVWQFEDTKGVQVTWESDGYLALISERL